MRSLVRLKSIKDVELVVLVVVVVVAADGGVCGMRGNGGEGGDGDVDSAFTDSSDCDADLLLLRLLLDFFFDFGLV